jgi:hypothetical protein
MKPEISLRIAVVSRHCVCLWATMHAANAPALETAIEISVIEE